MRYQLQVTVGWQRTAWQIIVLGLLLMIVSSLATAQHPNQQTDKEREEAKERAKQQAKEEELLRRFTYLDGRVVNAFTLYDYYWVQVPSPASIIRKKRIEFIDGVRYEVEADGKIYSFIERGDRHFVVGQKIRFRLDPASNPKKFIVMVPSKLKEKHYPLIPPIGSRRFKEEHYSFLPEMAFIQGKVFRDGQGVSGARVELARILEDGSTQKIDAAITKEIGSFVFSIMPDKATYRLTAKAKGMRTGSKDVDVDGVDLYRITISLLPAPK